MQPGMMPSLNVETSPTIDSGISGRLAVAGSTSMSGPGTSDSYSASMKSASLSLVETAFRELQQRLGAKRYSLWFEGKVGLAVQGDLLTVAVGSPFLLNWMQKQFREDVADVARTLLGPSARSVFVVDATLSLNQPANESAIVVANDGPETSPASHNDTASNVIKVSASPVDKSADKSSLSRALATVDAAGIRRCPAPVIVAPQGMSPSRSGAATANNGRSRRLAELNDFIPSPTTELVLSAARGVAAGQPTLFNPLYIHGPVGSGKTHLLEGICRQLKRTQPQLNVMLITSEAFGNYFTQALREHSLPSFRQRFRNVDVLLIDDIEFFESKRAFQEEFLHTFCELVDHGRQVVLTGARHPRLLTKLCDDLATRFLSGLVCRLDIPDAETRLKIVEAKAARLSGEFAPEALQYVAQRFQNSVRELEGALNCLHTLYTMNNKRVTLSAARQILADLERDCLRIVRLADVERVVCQVFGVKAKDLQSDSRVRTVSQPRMLAMYLARKHTQAAYTEIGQHFGGRNHSTVMSAERKVQKWLDDNTSIQVSSQTWTIGEILSTIEQQLLAG